MLALTDTLNGCVFSNMPFVRTSLLYTLGSGPSRSWHGAKLLDLQALLGQKSAEVVGVGLHDQCACLEARKHVRCVDEMGSSVPSSHSECGEMSSCDNNCTTNKSTIPVHAAWTT